MAYVALLKVLAGLTTGTTALSKILVPENVVTGRLKAGHAFMGRLHQDHIDVLSRIVDVLTGRIEEP
ncbi:hypothetical protein CGQ24_10165 [Arthrobacter sp. 7749]|nr:hypothetical protein CGQ24_10165 [Arthrobacter sp. 7749]